MRILCSTFFILASCATKPVEAPSVHTYHSENETITCDFPDSCYGETVHGFETLRCSGQSCVTTQNYPDGSLNTYCRGSSRCVSELSEQLKLSQKKWSSMRLKNYDCILPPAPNSLNDSGGNGKEEVIQIHNGKVKTAGVEKLFNVDQVYQGCKDVLASKGLFSVSFVFDQKGILSGCFSDSPKASNQNYFCKVIYP